MNFDKQEKEIIANFLDDRRPSINALTTEDELWKLTDKDTKKVIEKILAIHPSDYGINTKPIKKESVPRNILKIKGNVENKSGEYKLANSTYLPAAIYEAFSKMEESFSREHPSRKLMVGSGYRSPAFQLVPLLYILAKIYDFDISKTLRRVALPQYSQHCSVSNTAIDMLNIDGEPSDKNPNKFKDSIEYKWLCHNAKIFNFYESYPQNNKYGVMWEPWHWQFLPQ